MFENIFEDSQYKIGSETIVDGVEIYQDLEIITNGEITTISELKLSPLDDLVRMTMTGVSLVEDGVSVGTFDTLEGLFNPAWTEGISNLPEGDLYEDLINGKIDRTTCSEIDFPLSLSATQGYFSGDDTAFDFGNLTLSYNIIDATDNCILEFTTALSDVNFDDGDGFSFGADAIKMDMYASAFTEVAPRNLDDEYTASAEINGMTFSMGGVEQLRVDRLYMDTKNDASLMAAVIEAGFMAALADHAESVGATEIEDVLTMAMMGKMWNEMRKGDASGSFALDGVQITGQMPQAMTGLPILSMGRTLDITLDTQKSDENVDTNINITSPGVVNLGLGLSVIMTELDPGFENMHPSALMMSAPIAVSGLGVELLDEGLGDFIAETAGLDIYSDVPAMAEGMIGPHKAAKIKSWLSGAKQGGAYFMATPPTPMPIMQAFVGFMGDWETFGAMINAQAAAPQ
ncbi:hypothetical protein [Pacificibacter marinus]|uniref:hypothetical protein n=1 Tax=Pacificibacter marinus TaxID=658057 RepID=UPI00111358D8|nr:hypothetical protein [Pacificibacter marinus]